jgi:hypothetical protein
MLRRDIAVKLIHRAADLDRPCTLTGEGRRNQRAQGDSHVCPLLRELAMAGRLYAPLILMRRERHPRWPYVWPSPRW